MVQLIDYSFDSDELKKLYKILERIIADPELYIWSFFNELKHRIDLQFALKDIEEIDENLKIEINNNWTEIIHQVNVHEKECKANLIKFNSNLALFRKKLNQVQSTNRIIISNFDQKKLSLLDEINFLESQLFLNKTFIFKEEPALKTSAGKLIIITNKYFSSINMENYKKK